MIRSLLHFSRLSDASAVRKGGAAAGLAVAVVLGGAACMAPSAAPASRVNPIASSSIDDSSASASPSDSPSTPAPASVVATSSSPAAPPPAPAPARTTYVAPPPPKTATTKPAPPHPSLCGAPSNPYGYNFCGTGGYVTSPAGGTCSYFRCIANFSNGSGYMVECQDGMYSMSGGRRGACSDHGGVRQPVFSG